MLKTLNVVMNQAPGGAGRDPADTGKAHVNLHLQFDTPKEALSWMRRKKIDTTAIEPKR